MRVDCQLVSARRNRRCSFFLVSRRGEMWRAEWWLATVTCRNGTVHNGETTSTCIVFTEVQVEKTLPTLPGCVLKLLPWHNDDVPVFLALFGLLL